jgi:hypothetical protein
MHTPHASCESEIEAKTPAHSFVATTSARVARSHHNRRIDTYANHAGGSGKAGNRKELRSLAVMS